MKKFWSLVSKKVSISPLQGLGLVSVSDVKMNVSVSWKSGNVSISVSSRTKIQTSRSHLGLAPQGLVYITAFTIHVVTHSSTWYKRLRISQIKPDLQTLNPGFHPSRDWRFPIPGLKNGRGLQSLPSYSRKLTQMRLKIKRSKLCFK